MVLHSFRAPVTVATNIFAFLLPLNTSPYSPSCRRPPRPLRPLCNAPFSRSPADRPPPARRRVPRAAPTPGPSLPLAVSCVERRSRARPPTACLRHAAGSLAPLERLGSSTPASDPGTPHLSPPPHLLLLYLWGIEQTARSSCVRRRSMTPSAYTSSSHAALPASLPSCRQSRRPSTPVGASPAQRCISSSSPPILPNLFLTRLVATSLSPRADLLLPL